MIVKSRKQALVDGDKSYYTGEPCFAGHISRRDTANHQCVQCRKEKRRLPVSGNEAAFRRLKYKFSSSDLSMVFDYNPLTGSLTWSSGLNRHKSGCESGCIIYRGATRYRSVCLHGKRYLSHRIVFFIINGRLPDCIDHINGNGLDNRLANLREVSHQENMKNARISKSSKTGVCGVCIDRRSGRYRAYIVANGKQKHLGIFETLYDAKIARENASLKFGFHKMHGAKKDRTQ